ncbi:hypothetical protein AB9K26_02330 [Psychroserpens sp. XS_ASV72]|uniref:tetratricopeptide repeat-containing sensor histidine kinase n=1 Tax=Psychroserpens sp. XS_ASV72 TaxID=3241293 RepID=UPI003515B2D3
MKSIVISFLIFFSAIWLVHSSDNVELKVQNASVVDSLSYYRDLALKPKSKDDLIKVYEFFKNRNETSLSQKDTLNIIYNLRYIAMTQFDLGLLQDSEKIAVEALEYIDNFSVQDTRATENRVGIYNHLGRVYNRLKDYKSALWYYEKAEVLQKDPVRLNTLKTNKALIYYEQGNFHEAFSIYLDVHRFNLKGNDRLKIARSLCNLGMTMSKMDMPGALDSIHKSLEIREHAGYTTGMVDSYLKLSDYYKDSNNLQKALQNAEQALALTRINKKVHEEVEVLSVLMKLNSNNDINRYTFLKDSLYNLELNVQNSYAAKKYALEKQMRLAQEKELKIKEVELDNATQKQLKLYYLIIAIILLFLAVFIVFYLRSKHKKDKLQEVYKTESRISKKVHDEVANDVFQLMTKLESNSNIESEVVDDLHGLYYRTRDIAQEHGTISHAYPFSEQLTALIENYQNTETNIIVKGLSEVNYTMLSEIKKMTIYKVLQELLINMKKHSKASIVVVSFQKDNGKHEIRYSDNGVGCDIKKGNGLQNTENRIQAINGTITFESEPNKGFKAKIKF